MPADTLFNTILDTTSTFQNHRYPRIFPLGHEPPLDLLNSSILIRNEEKERKEKIEITNLKSNSKL